MNIVLVDESLIILPLLLIYFAKVYIDDYLFISNLRN